VTYDHRLSRRWSFHGGVLARNGSHELIVDPVRTATAAELQLRGDGGSRYRDAEAGVHFTHSTQLDIDATYVRSSAARRPQRDHGVLRHGAIAGDRGQCLRAARQRHSAPAAGARPSRADRSMAVPRCRRLAHGFAVFDR
jgi:hypothetical protein